MYAFQVFHYPAINEIEIKTIQYTFYLVLYLGINERSFIFLGLLGKSIFPEQKA